MLPLPAVQSPKPLPGFDQLYDEYFGFVWKHAAGRGVPHASLDDVVQEVFMVVHRKLPEFEGRASLRTWLAAITRRVARDHLRKLGNRAAGEPLQAEPVSPQASPSEALAQRQAAALLESIVHSMPEPQREAFVLCEVEQWTAVEAAELLEINENTLRTRLRAARKAFNAALARHRARNLWGDSHG